MQIVVNQNGGPKKLGPDKKSSSKKEQASKSRRSLFKKQPPEINMSVPSAEEKQATLPEVEEAPPVSEPSAVTGFTPPTDAGTVTPPPIVDPLAAGDMPAEEEEPPTIPFPVAEAVEDKKAEAVAEDPAPATMVKPAKPEFGGKKPTASDVVDAPPDGGDEEDDGEAVKLKKAKRESKKKLSRKERKALEKVPEAEDADSMEDADADAEELEQEEAKSGGTNIVGFLVSLLELAGAAGVCFFIGTRVGTTLFSQVISSILGG